MNPKAINDFGRVSVAALMIGCLFTTAVDAEDLSYSDRMCAGDVCKLLRNEKPDYANVEAVVLSVIDADTLKLRLFVLPGLTYEINVRSLGVDAPEYFQPACDREKELAIKARNSVEKKFGAGTWVSVSDIGFDKYGNRILGTIRRQDSDRLKSLTKELIETGYGVSDPNGNSKYDWCLERQG